MKKRGSIYQFIDENAKVVEKYALVVSDDTRGADKLINVIILSDKGFGSDSIVIPDFTNADGHLMYAHCGLVTYIASYKLGECVASLDEDVMYDIDMSISGQLGLTTNYQMYKKMYEDLLTKVVD